MRLPTYCDHCTVTCATRDIDYLRETSSIIALWIYNPTPSGWCMTQLLMLSFHLSIDRCMTRTSALLAQDIRVSTIHGTIRTSPFYGNLNALCTTWDASNLALTRVRSRHRSSTNVVNFEQVLNQLVNWTKVPRLDLALTLLTTFLRRGARSNVPSSTVDMCTQ